MDRSITKKIVTYLLSKKILVDPTLLETLDTAPSCPPGLLSLFSSDEERQSFLSFITPHFPFSTNHLSLSDPPSPTTHSPLPTTNPSPPTATPSCTILFSYTGETKKRTVDDFVSFYNKRYEALAAILQPRKELEGSLSISRVLAKTDQEKTSIIGIVKSKAETKNKNLMLEMEDPTGVIKVVVNKSRPDLFRVGKEIFLDEVIGITGKTGDKIIFADNIIYPDIPQREIKKCDHDCGVVFTSDLHIGSKQFLEESFLRFIAWLNGEVGDEQQRALVRNLKYVFLLGDVVDGVGVYPGQEEDLAIPDARAQYAQLAAYLKQIPSRLRIIICPGNHDAVRLAEPQPVLSKEYAGALYTLPNVTLVSSPSLVRLEESTTFPGFDVLVYHGCSFDYFIAESNTIREAGGYDRADLVMTMLLKRRHLAPTHNATQSIPDPQCDPMVIEKVPDFFVTGHLHKATAAQYKHVTLLCASCWQGKTAYQEKVGHIPDPSRIFYVDLRTRKVKILKF